MYRCEFCNKLIGPSIAQNRVVTKTRGVNYSTVIEKVDKKTGKKTRFRKNSKGWEIVEEKIGCLDCVKLFYEENKNGHIHT
jgi:hypothetical protein